MATEASLNEDVPQYELHVDGVLVGLIAVVPGEGVWTLPHEEIFDEFGGRGLGGVLAQGALDDLRARGLKVNPTCPFVKAWIGKHPKYADLLL